MSHVSQTPILFQNIPAGTVQRAQLGLSRREVPAGSKSNKPTQAFVNVVAAGSESESAKQEYRPIGDALADPELRAQLVQRAMEKLVRVQREFRVLRELETVWNAIDEAVAGA